MKLPLFPTSTVGSLPQPQELRRARTALQRGTLASRSYWDLVHKHTARWIDFQKEIGLDVLVGGEFAREDMAAYFAVHFGGRVLDFVPSYENRRYRPAEYFREVSAARHSLLRKDFLFAVSRSSAHPLKETITGPATLADWALIRHPPYYRDRNAFRADLAKALRREIEFLRAYGMKILQIDEPALTTDMDTYEMDLKAIRKTVDGLQDKLYLILHICYSDQEALDKAFPSLLELPFHQIHMEMANRNYALLDLVAKHGFADKDIGLGVIDVHTDRIETVEEIREGVERACRYIAPRRIHLLPDCGFKERREEIAKEKLRVMVRAAERCREDFLRRRI